MRWHAFVFVRRPGWLKVWRIKTCVGHPWRICAWSTNVEEWEGVATKRTATKSGKLTSAIDAGFVHIFRWKDCSLFVSFFLFFSSVLLSFPSFFLHIFYLSILWKWPYFSLISFININKTFNTHTHTHGENHRHIYIYIYIYIYQCVCVCVCVCVYVRMCMILTHFLIPSFSLLFFPNKRKFRLFFGYF